MLIVLALSFWYSSSAESHYIIQIFKMNPILRVNTSATQPSLDYLFHEDEDCSRMIHRTFAFDEWDEEETLTNEASEAIVGLQSEIHEATDEYIHYEPEEESRQRTIYRSFAFDEWDNEVSENFEEEVMNERSFIPINSDGENHGTETTKFDIDNIHITSTTVTPSHTPDKFPHFDYPFPVYPSRSVRRLDFSSVLPDGQNTKTTPCRQQNLDPDFPRTLTNMRPDDYSALKHMLRQKFVYSPMCESIPRRGTAFHTVTPTVEPSSPSSSANHWNDAPKNCHSYPHLPDNQFLDQEDTGHVFENPSSSFEGNHEVSPIPEFVVIYKSV